MTTTIRGGLPTYTQKVGKRFYAEGEDRQHHSISLILEKVSFPTNDGYGYVKVLFVITNGHAVQKNQYCSLI